MLEVLSHFTAGETDGQRGSVICLIQEFSSGGHSAPWGTRGHVRRHSFVMMEAGGGCFSWCPVGEGWATVRPLTGHSTVPAAKTDPVPSVRGAQS